MPNEPAKREAKEADTPAEGAAAADPLTTEVVGSAESYRKLGEIFVSALAAIPTATLVTTLISAPGDAGLHDWKLAAGIALAALAIVIGVQLAIWLRTPVEVTREALTRFPMQRVIGTSQDSYDELLTRIGELQDALATADDAKRPTVERHFQAVVATLRNVQLLATADALRARVLHWKTQALAGAALIAAAAAIFFLATAPKPKPTEKAAAGPTVVKVTLTTAGAKKLGCPKTTFNALKHGGTDTEPQVVPLDGLRCTAGDYLTLKVAEKEGLATEVKAVEPVSPAPTSTAPSATTTKTTTP
jgi:hypothetical protein